jgi:hypothetical protein
MVKDIHVHSEDYENILINVEYLINRRYVCFTCYLSRKVHPVKGPYTDYSPSAIYSTKAKTLEVSMTEKFLLLARSSYTACMKQRKR